MANTTPSLALTSLDFDTNRANFVTFLKSQAQFKDFNFEAANISVLLDILMYNTYLGAFYTNMVGSEMFLDTCQLRDSAVLRAKEINYCPRSFRSSFALINLEVDSVGGNTTILTIPSGTSFTAKAGSNSYTFSTNTNLVIAANTDGNFYASNVAIYEGTSVTDTFIVQPASNTDAQQFVLSNPQIDTNSLTVVSIENNGANVVPYSLSTTLLDLKSTSPVYFLQGSDNSQYEIIFGDNVVGRRPIDNAVVVANYLTTNGQLPNGISTFTPNGTIGGSTDITVTTVAIASGGDIGESIDSIKYNAPRYYPTQERAVTATDYDTLLVTSFPEIQAISAYGGEDAVPPQYGAMIISLKLFNFVSVPQGNITKYTNFLQARGWTQNLIFIEPNYTFASINTTVKYNVNITTAQPTDIETFVTSAIQTYSSTNLEDFNSTLYYSAPTPQGQSPIGLCESINAADPSVVSNETSYRIMKKFTPVLNTPQNFAIAFNMPVNSLFSDASLVYPSSEMYSVMSSSFVYNGLRVHLADNGNGVLQIVQSQNDGNNHVIVNSGVGSVDYTSGYISLTNFTCSAFDGDSVRIYCVPLNLDNATSQNTIFEIPNDEINITVLAVRV